MLRADRSKLSLADIRMILRALPWPALIANAGGKVVFANRAAKKIPGLHRGAPLPSDVHESRIPPFESLSARSLDDSQPYRARAQPIRTAGRGTYTLVILGPPRRPGDLAAALSQAAAACLDAPDQQHWCALASRALAPLGIDAHLALACDAGRSSALIATSFSADLVNLLESRRGLAVAELLQPALSALGTSDEPRMIDLAAATPALACLIGGEQCLALPLRDDGRTLGGLILSGPGLDERDLAAAAPFGALLGVSLRRLRERATHTVDHAELLLRAGQALTQVTDLDAVLVSICEQAEAITGATTAAVLLLEPDGRHLRCVMATGPGSEAILGRRRRLFSSIVGRVFRERQHLVIDDARGYPDLDPTIRTRTILRSGIFQRLQAQGHAIGVLAVGHPDPGFFDSRRVILLEQFAGSAAVALENAQLHESIRRSEERHRALFQNALEIVIALDLDGRITSWNRAALQFLGLSPAELRGQPLNIRDALSPQAARWVREMQERALLGQPTSPAEIPVRRPDGSEAVVEITLQLLQERGQPAGVYLIGRDITERHRQQQALAQQVAQLTALHKLSIALSASLEHGPIVQRAVESIAIAHQFAGVAVYVPDGDHLTLSAATFAPARPETRRIGAESLIGCAWRSGESWIGATLELPEPFRSEYLERGVSSCAVVPLLGARGAHGVLMIGRAGDQVFTAAELRVIQTMAAQIAQALENVALYAAVEQSAARYRDLYENANDFIGTVTTDGRVLSLNRAALSFFGYNTEDLPRLNLAHLLPDRDVRALRRMLDALIQGQQSASHELDIVRANGEIATLEIRSRLLYEGDEPVAIHFIARDITERKQLETQVRQSEKLAALGQLVAGAAHELNNPLAVVLGTTQLLLHDPLAARFADDVRTIEAAAQRAKHIVKQLLTFARQQEDVRAPVDVTHLIRRVVDGARAMLQHHAVELQIQIAPRLAPIWGDSYQLEQVLDNLIHNAVQAMAGTTAAPRIVIAAATRGDRVQLRVSDNGPGIAPQHLPRIFDPFFTTKDVGKGTGLGLSLVYGIVDKHGGTTRVESQPGRGATFIIELPASQIESTPAPTLATPDHRRSAVLVVEDEVDVRRILERALSQHGYVVDTVENGDVALQRLRERRYDLVITDLRMPGMSGNELFERARSIDAGLKWIFVTGDTMSSSSEAFLQSSGMPYLPKPFSLDELWEAVAAAMLPREEQKAA